MKCNPKLYRKYVVTEKGQHVLYVELIKALYGTLRAALLFWHRLSKKLVDWGSPLTPMTGVLPTSSSRDHSAQSYGTSMT